MARRVSLKAKRHHVGNAACSCELFMENEGMDWSNAGKGYTHSAGKASWQGHGEGGLPAYDFCARYSDCAAPMDEEH